MALLATRCLNRHLMAKAARAARKYWGSAFARRALEMAREDCAKFSSDDFGRVHPMALTREADAALAAENYSHLNWLVLEAAASAMRQRYWQIATLKGAVK